jgi:hypothetical protein
MTVLISTSTTAVRSVGVSARRLEASLLADDIIADLEIQMKQGVAPEIDESESVTGPYSVRILRSDISQELGASNQEGAGLGIATMLGAELPEVAKHLKQYDIEISWFEQNGPHTVTRTTFAFDWQAAALEFGDLFQQGGDSGTTGDLDELNALSQQQEES